MNFFNKPLMKIHLIGICGSGMSALARILSEQGHQVSGSDLKAESRKVDGFESKIQIFHDHQSSHVFDKDIVIYSSAIPSGHVELSEARRLGIPTLHRSIALDELIRPKHSVGVSGMHGKTSTTGMIANIFLEAGLDPTVAVGGSFDFLSGNARQGQGPWAVFEADESDGTLLKYHPDIAVVTNLETEHLDFFKDFESILRHFKKFTNQVKQSVIINADDAGCQALIGLMDPAQPCLTFGFSESAQVRAHEIQKKQDGMQFGMTFQGQEMGVFELSILGRHQVANALAAIAAAVLLKIDLEIVKRALKNFKGALRRFEILGQVHGIHFVDDYAHHPTEICVTLNTAREHFAGKILTIFQPHRYTRTFHFRKEFAQALSLSDDVIVTDVYPSSETAIPGVTGKMIYDEMKALGKKGVLYLEDFQSIEKYLHENFLHYSLVITLGAGNITSLARNFLKSFTEEALAWKKIRGKVLNAEPMSGHTTFRLGGPADFWIEPIDLEDLLETQKFACLKGLPIYLIGNGSNMIVRDGGIRGVVIRLSSPCFRKLQIENEFLTAGSGLSLAEVIRGAVQAGLSGLENLKGIPGTIGGALHFNAGAYGTEIGEKIYSVLVLNPDGSLQTLSKERLGFEYRSCPSLKGKIILQAMFLLKRAEVRQISKRVFELKTERSGRYPKLPNAGCIFKNPQGDFAGQLIDQTGLKDFAIGDAQISSQHANFIVNKGRAKASDVLTLIEEVRKKVYQSHKVLLENEVEVFGEDV